MARAGGGRDKVRGSGQPRADGRAESVGKTEHHRVDGGGELADVDPLRHGGVENPRAVQMHRKAGIVGDGAERLHLARAQTGAALAVVGVLQAEQPGAWLMDVGFADGAAHLLRSQPAVLALEWTKL